MKHNIKRSELEQIFAKLESIEDFIVKQTDSDLSSFIPERKAKELLDRKSTWFWTQRKAGLPYKKLGGEVYYNLRDLIQLLEDPAERRRRDD